jgi:hypothetical protein
MDSRPIVATSHYCWDILLYWIGLDCLPPGNTTTILPLLGRIGQADNPDTTHYGSPATTAGYGLPVPVAPLLGRAYIA